MTHTFTNKKGISYLLLDVPEDAMDFCLCNNVLEVFFVDEEKFSSILHLPKGNYELIGLAKEVSDEGAADIVDQSIHTGLFMHHNGLDNIFCYKTATESLSSLVQSLGLNNPIILKLIK